MPVDNRSLTVSKTRQLDSPIRKTPNLIGDGAFTPSCYHTAVPITMDQNVQSTTQQQQQRQQPAYDPNNNGGHYGTLFPVHDPN